jgi:DNA-binding response OmpR family regulator
MHKVLVIEDDEMASEAVCELLRLEKFLPIWAHNGEEGLEKAKTEQPDLILCDVMMPGMDGYAVLRKLREDASTAFIPVILLSALAERWNVRKGMETGADDYLGKPVLRQELLGAIRAQLNRRKGSPGGSGRHIPPASP